VWASASRGSASPAPAWSTPPAPRIRPLRRVLRTRLHRLRPGCELPGDLAAGRADGLLPDPRGFGGGTLRGGVFFFGLVWLFTATANHMGMTAESAYLTLPDAKFKPEQREETLDT